MLKQFLLLFPCIVFLISCSHTEYSANQEEENKGMEIVTDYDGNQYKTVKIGNQILGRNICRETIQPFPFRIRENNLPMCHFKLPIFIYITVQKL